MLFRWNITNPVGVSLYLLQLSLFISLSVSACVSASLLCVYSLPLSHTPCAYASVSPICLSTLSLFPSVPLCIFLCILPLPSVSFSVSPSPSFSMLLSHLDTSSLPFSPFRLFLLNSHVSFFLTHSLFLNTHTHTQTHTIKFLLSHSFSHDFS